MEANPKYRQGTFVIRLIPELRYFFVLLSICICTSVKALEINFNVVYKGDTIGGLHVSKTFADDQIHFTYALDITSAVLFKKVRVQYEMNATYDKTAMRNYHLIYTVNGEINDDISMNWEADHYTIKSLNKKDTDRHDHLINFTTVLLFFNEPTKRTRVWGERNCRYQALSRTTDEGYSMDVGGGRSNTFYYKGGLLVKALFDTTILDFEILRERK